MQRGFPVHLLPLLRCPADGAVLRATSGEADGFIPDGTVQCGECHRSYAVRDGILSLLDVNHLHPETAIEMDVRDVRSASVLEGTRREWSSRFADETEVRPTLDAVAAAPPMVVCELGCGPGRYTLALAERSSAVVAVDVSRAGLLVLRQKLGPVARVALVQADVTTPICAPQSFDRVLSTLHSNLPSRDHRMSALTHVARSLRDGGRAVISMHHYTLKDAVMSVPASSRYPDSGIYRYYMTTRESLEEAGQSFGRLRHQFIGASIPGVPSVTASRAAARIPLMRAALGTLFLALGEEPLPSATGRSPAGTSRLDG